MPPNDVAISSGPPETQPDPPVESNPFWATSEGAALWKMTHIAGGTDGADLPVAKHLASLLADLPSVSTVTLDKKTSSVIAWIGWEGEPGVRGCDPVFIDSHLDTVCPTWSAPSIDANTQLLSGPWLDNRIGCALLYVLAQRLEPTPAWRRSLALVFSGDEETDMRGAARVALRHKWADGVVFDLCDGALCDPSSRIGDCSSTPRPRTAPHPPVEGHVGCGVVVEPLEDVQTPLVGGSAALISRTNCVPCWQHTAQPLPPYSYPCNLKAYAKHVGRLRWCAVAIAGDMHGTTGAVAPADVLDAASLLQAHALDMVTHVAPISYDSDW